MRRLAEADKKKGGFSGTAGADPYPPVHEIEGITTLSLRENGIGGPVPRDYHRLCNIRPNTT